MEKTSQPPGDRHRYALDGQPAVGVLGEGLEALAAACTLAARGHRVLLFMRPAGAGRPALHEEAGFHFACEPGVISEPRVLRRIFAEAGERLEDHCALERVEPRWRAFFGDGSSWDAPAAPEEVARERITVAGRDSTGILQFYARLWQKGAPPHPRLGHHRDADAITANAGPSHAALQALAKSTPADSDVGEWLAGGGGQGLWRMEGGARALAKTLEGLALALGVECFRGKVRIASERARRQLRGVELENGDFVALSALLSTRAVAIETPAHDAGLAHGRSLSTLAICLGVRGFYSHLRADNLVVLQTPWPALGNAQTRQPQSLRLHAAPGPGAPGETQALTVLLRCPASPWQGRMESIRGALFEVLRTHAGLGDLEERLVVERTLCWPEPASPTPSGWRAFLQMLTRQGALKDLHFIKNAVCPGPALLAGWLAADRFDNACVDFEPAHHFDFARAFATAP